MVKRTRRSFDRSFKREAAGMVLGLEFLPWTGIPTLAAANHIAEHGGPAAGILLDTALATAGIGCSCRLHGGWTTSQILEDSPVAGLVFDIVAFKDGTALELPTFVVVWKFRVRIYACLCFLTNS